MFEGWAGWSLICPDLKEGDGFVLHGDSASMKTQNWEFKINRCNDTLQKEMKRKPCHPKEEMDEWIKDILV